MGVRVVTIVVTMMRRIELLKVIYNNVEIYLSIYTCMYACMYGKSACYFSSTCFNYVSYMLYMKDIYNNKYKM